MISNKRFGRNYDLNLLTLRIDRRGFRVSESRLGFAKLGAGSGYVDALAGFNSISIGMAAQVVDDAFLEQQISSLRLSSPNGSLFNAYDGERITLAYNGSTLFEGYVDTSTVDIIFDQEDRKEKFSVTLTARSFDAITYQQPIALGATTVYGTPENPGNNVVAGRNGEKINTRANAVTNESVAAEDTISQPYIEEQVGQITSEDQNTNQGAFLTEMSHRAGVLIDLTGLAPKWRAYQSVPHWRITDADVSGGGFSLDTDRDSPGALIYTRAENDGNRIAYSANGRTKIEREVSTNDLVNWGLTHAAAVTPLKKLRSVVLTKFSAPFNANVPLVSRLPLKVTFNRAAVTYRGAVVGMTHSITPVTWQVAVEVAPVHLVTRVSDVTPAAVQHLRTSVGVGTFTASWTPTEKVCTATAAGTTTTLKTSDAAALDVTVGDQVYVYKADGTLRDPRIATVVTEVSASGTTTITLDVAMGTATAIGDWLKLADFGVPTPLWDVYYKPSSNFVASPLDGAALKVSTAVPTVTVSGLAAGPWTVTVIAKTADGFRSPPSIRTTLTVT